MNKSGKIVSIILWALIVISAILIISLLVNISDTESDPTMGSWINTNLIWTYILIVIGAAVAILAGLYQMFTDKRAAKKGIISIVFLGAVALIAYLLASPEIPQFIGVDKFIDSGKLTERVAKLVDTGLYATYILFGLAVIAIAFSSVSKLFK